MSLPVINRRLRRSIWATIAFLGGFAALITFISLYYLIPALEAANNADPAQRKALSAYSTLLMALVLVLLGIGIILVFRIRRFFLSSGSHEKTKYVDAWAEAGKRLDQ